MQEYPGDAERRCPDCGYSTVGLPSEHRCPECGLDFDPHCVTVRFPKRRQAGKEVVLAALLIATALWVARYHGIDRAGWVFVGFLAAILLWNLHALFRMSGTAGARMMVSHGGARFEFPRECHAIAWDQISRGTFLRLPPMLVIWGKSGLPLAWFLASRVGGRRPAKKCASEIERLRRVYRPEVPD